MRFPKNLLNLLIEQDAFRVCRLMRAEEFARYCKERGVNVDTRRLRQLERINAFRPMLRSYGPDVVRKIERLGNRYRDLGILADGESWEGETQTEIAEFDASTEMTENWRGYGLVWVPGQGAWPHEATIETEPQRHQAYYSRFQIYPLSHAVSSLTLRVHLEWAVTPDGATDPTWNPRLRQRASNLASQVAMSLRGPHNDDIVAILMQLIANRFFYKTQTDERLITIGQFVDWNWYEYARSWRPEPVVNALEITAEESLRFYEGLDLEWTHVDPMARWYNLARFVKVEKRKQLKGDALRGLALREMAYMFRLFHKATFDVDPRPLGEVGVQIIHRIPDIDAEADPMRALELSANDFGVNAKPRLVLFVEGLTEQAILPIIFERLWGAPPSRYSIEISNLGGVDNAAGGKEAPFSALWRLVDYLHHHQTLAFVLLDNEGFASRNVALGLPKAHSVHSVDRKATRPDHIKVWRTSFELENFSDSELAQALNLLVVDRLFSRSDVAACRASIRAGSVKGQKIWTIDRLFESKAEIPLDKPKLALILADIMFAETTRRKADRRPISCFLRRAARKAARNFQPVTQDDWERNQRSGYLATLQPAARRERKRRSDMKRRERTRAPKLE